MKQRNLLVTGGAGFIGANYVHYWLEQYPNDKVVVLDALTYAGNQDNLTPVQENPNFIFVHGDICNTELVETLLKEHQLDTIVHFAAESHVDRSIGPDALSRLIFSALTAYKSGAVWLDEPKPKAERR